MKKIGENQESNIKEAKKEDMLRRAKHRHRADTGLGPAMWAEYVECYKGQQDAKTKTGRKKIG